MVIFKKFIIIFTIFLFVLLGYQTYSSASTLTDSILNTSSDNENDVNENIINDVQEDDTIPTGSNLQQETSVFSNLPESELGLANVLNILLIVVGVLIILLAIAILIRLK